MGQKTEMQEKIRAQFDAHEITESGEYNLINIRLRFSDLLTALEQICVKDSREMSICRTKLEEACFFAIKSASILHQKV